MKVCSEVDFSNIQVEKFKQLKGINGLDIKKNEISFEPVVGINDSEDIKKENRRKLLQNVKSIIGEANVKDIIY